MKKSVDECVAVLRKGGIILYPTDTIWGIGCDATNKEAVARIYRIKNREDSKSLISLVDSFGMISDYVKNIPSMAEPLIDVSDKPLTIIYPNVDGLATNLIAPDGTAAIRVVSNEFCQRVIVRLGKPIVSTSANISGTTSPSNYNEIPTQIRDLVDWIADPRFEGESTHKASSIIKLGAGNEVEVIR